MNKSVKNTNHVSIRTFTRFLIFLWLIALVILIGFNLNVYNHLRKEIYGTQETFESNVLSVTQRLSVQRVVYLSRLLLLSTSEDIRQNVRTELSYVITQLEANQQSLIAKDMSKDIYLLNFENPHHIDANLQLFLGYAKALTMLPSSQLSLSDPNFEKINQQAPTLINSLDQISKQYETEIKMKMESIDIHESWNLSGNLIILMLVSLFIIFPMFHKIHEQFSKIAGVNEDLSEKTKELERSRLAALSMMEDAQLAKKYSEDRRGAAERLVAIIESSQDAIIGKTLDGTLTSWNKGAEKIFGYTSEEVLGKSIKLIVPPEKYQELEKILQKIGKGERLDHFETLRLRKDGKVIDISLAVSPIKDADGQLIGASAIARDITEIKRARQIIQEREKWFGALIENSSDLLIQLDTEGKIIFVSPSLKRILGYEIEDILNKIIFDFIHPDDLNVVKTLFKEILVKADNAVSGEARFKHKDHSWRWLEGTGKNLLNNPNIKAVIINARDFTERKRFEEKLKEFTAELKKNNAELESFAFIASHDLQEPLRIVSSYAQLFTQRYQERLDETSLRYLNYIVDNVKRMQDMISGLLVYSRIGRQGQPLSLVDTGKICDVALANLKFSIEQKNVKIQKGNLPILLINEVELLQLFQNLIGNAIKYSDKEVPIVEISSYKGEDCWVFCIKDNGIGIEPEYFQQIFEIFKRLHTQKEYPGTGIGLSICKKIVDNNGGEIWVESKLWEGSKFFFKLPVRKGSNDES